MFQFIALNCFLRILPIFVSTHKILTLCYSWSNKQVYGFSVLMRTGKFALFLPYASPQAYLLSLVILYTMLQHHEKKKESLFRTTKKNVVHLKQIYHGFVFHNTPIILIHHEILYVSCTPQRPSFDNTLFLWVWNKVEARFVGIVPMFFCLLSIFHIDLDYPIISPRLFLLHFLPMNQFFSLIVLYKQSTC